MEIKAWIPSACLVRPKNEHQRYQCSPEYIIDIIILGEYGLEGGNKIQPNFNL